MVASAAEYDLEDTPTTSIAEGACALLGSMDLLIYDLPPHRVIY